MLLLQLPRRLRLQAVTAGALPLLLQQLLHPHKVAASPTDMQLHSTLFTCAAPDEMGAANFLERVQ